MRWKEGSMRGQCKDVARDGSSCTNEELPDLEYCFAHAPADLVQMAEHMTGKKRCAGIAKYKQHIGAEDWSNRRCGNASLPQSEWCTYHLRVKGDVQRYVQLRIDQLSSDEIAALSKHTDLPQEVYDKLNGIMTPIGNPFEELLLVAAEMKAFKDRVGARVAEMKIEEFRYGGDRIGEQLRAEVLVYERALDRLAVTLVKITRLNIEERLVRITERQAAVIEAAITGALADLNLSVELQEAARMNIVHRLSSNTTAPAVLPDGRIVQGELE